MLTWMAAACVLAGLGLFLFAVFRTRRGVKFKWSHLSYNQPPFLEASRTQLMLEGAFLLIIGALSLTIW